MRKLLVKLVAAETAVLGWLTYWLFLVYANNPSVSQELSTELSRFPQISYTTIDISIILIITVFSILLAIKFDRGLRPGMKLERALQMLENLMKRNLFLESQLAEFRGDKPPVASFGSQTQHAIPSSLPTSSIASTDSLQLGTWEKAFRTPIEAGPSNAKITLSPPTSSPISKPSSFDSGYREIHSPSGEQVAKDEKATPKPLTSSSWEDSPARTLETKGIIIPAQPSPRKPLPVLTTLTPPSTTRLPYIPAPAPKIPPPSVITSATTRPTPLQTPLKPGVPAQARPAVKPLSSSQPVNQPGKPPGSLQPLTTLTPISTSPSSNTKRTSEPARPATTQKPTSMQDSEIHDDDAEDLDSAEGKDDDEDADDQAKKTGTTRKTSSFDEDSD